MNKKMMVVIESTNYGSSRIAIEATSSVIEALSSIIGLLENGGKLEQSKEDPIIKIISSSEISFRDGGESTIPILERLEKKVTDLEEKNQKNNSDKEREVVYYENRHSARAKGVTDKEWRKQVMDCHSWNLSGLKPKSE